MAAINSGVNWVEAEVFGNFIGRNYGMGSTRYGFGAGGGQENVFGSFLVDESLDHEEQNKHSENQNGYHYLILRPFVLGFLLEVLGF